jgi:hypothetical protein
VKKITPRLFVGIKHYDPSKLSVLFLIVFTVFYSLEYIYYKRSDRIIASDVIHYYAYLPATFIYKDLSLDFVYEDPGLFGRIFWPVNTPNGKHAIMVTMGMSILYAPAFLITHSIVSLTGGDTSGFSEPYRLGLVIMGWVYLFLALLLLRKFLLRYYSKYVTALTLLITLLGTNLFHYSTAETTMSHQYSFFLFTTFLLLTIQWHEKPRLSKAILIGIVSALITLVRPSNVLIGFIFVFWGVESFRGIHEKLLFFLKNYTSVLLIFVFAFLVWSPQFLYWKFYTGDWFFLGYAENGSNFFFSNPQIINNLFSYRKGWLVYTPLMLLAFIGLGILWNKKRGFAIPIIIYSIINIYLVSSWWSWWYGGSFGMRAYVETYAVYALGFAAFIDWAFRRKMYVRIPVLIIVLALVGFSYFQTRQYYYGSIHWIGMNKEAYWHQFLKLKPYGDYYRKLTIPDMEKAREGIYEYKPVE